MASDSSPKLDIPHDPPFQNRTWMIQRMGWITIGLLVIGALTGLFGQGPIAHSVVESQSGRLQVAYDRFVRYESPAAFTIHLRSGDVPGKAARITFSQSYLEAIHIKNILPPPDSSEATSDGLIFVFQLADSSQPTVVIFSVTTRTIGWIDTRIGASDSDFVSFRQLVYP